MHSLIIVGCDFLEAKDVLTLIYIHISFIPCKYYHLKKAPSVIGIQSVAVNEDFKPCLMLREQLYGILDPCRRLNNETPTSNVKQNLCMETIPPCMDLLESSSNSRVETYATLLKANGLKYSPILTDTGLLLWKISV